MRPPLGLETARKGRLSLVGAPQAGRTMALADTFSVDALPPLSDEWMAEIRRRLAEVSAGTATIIPGKSFGARRFLIHFHKSQSVREALTPDLQGRK